MVDSSEYYSPPPAQPYGSNYEDRVLVHWNSSFYIEEVEYIVCNEKKEKKTGQKSDKLGDYAFRWARASVLRDAPLALQLEHFGVLLEVPCNAVGVEVVD